MKYDQYTIAELLVKPGKLLRDESTKSFLTVSCTTCNQLVQPVYTEGQLYRYDPTSGVWVAYDQAACTHFIGKLRDRMWTLREERMELSHDSIRGALAIAYTMIRDDNFFAVKTNIGFTNGVVELTSAGQLELHAHCCKHRIKHALKFPYEKRETPKWDKLLSEIWVDCEDAHARIRFLPEFIGAALFGIAHEFKKVLVFIGQGRNGKTTVQSIIESLFSPETVSHSNPQTWHHEYSRAALKDTRLITTSELPEGEFLDSAPFKAIIEGAAIQARVIREAPFEFRSRAACLFAANAWLRSKDFTEGFFRRFILMEFPNQFAQGADVALPIIKEEQPGIVYAALQACAEAFKRTPRMYEIPQSSADLLEQWKHEIDPVLWFTTEIIVPDETARIASLDLYLLWVEWAKERGHHPMTMTAFMIRLKTIFDARFFGRDKRRRYCKVGFTLMGTRFKNTHLYKIASTDTEESPQ